MKQGVGFLFVVALWVLFSIRPEARVSIMYFIFPLIALIQSIDDRNIRPVVVWSAVIFSLILSRFWFKINVPGMAEYFKYENYTHYTDFPAQRYFMTSGHWQSHSMYYVCILLTIIVIAVLYMGIRNKWFINKKFNERINCR